MGKLCNAWEVILKKIQRYVTDLYLAHKLRLPQGTVSVDCMAFFSLSDYTKLSSIKLINWQRLRSGWIKLNADGGCKGNPGKSGGGGIFRDCNGDFLLAYCDVYGYGTSMQAESMVVFCGLQFVAELGGRYVWLELDSLELVLILQGLHQCSWRLHYVVRNIRKAMEQYSYTVTHIMREGKQGANELANEAIQRGEG